MQLGGYDSIMAKLTEDLKAAIKASGQTAYVIARGAKVARSQLSRLNSGENAMSVNTIERITAYLELEIIIRPKTKPTKGGK